MSERGCPTGCGRPLQKMRRRGSLHQHRNPLCGTCWALVPDERRAEVHRTWREWQRDLTPQTYQAFRDACDVAVALAGASDE
jgi:hypothetical protein